MIARRLIQKWFHVLRIRDYFLHILFSDMSIYTTCVRNLSGLNLGFDANYGVCHRCLMLNKYPVVLRSVIRIKVRSHWSPLAISMQQNSVNCPLHVKFDRFSWLARARATPHHAAPHFAQRHSRARVIASGGKYQEQGFTATRGNYARGRAGFRRLNRAFALAARNTSPYKSDDVEGLTAVCLS